MNQLKKTKALLEKIIEGFFSPERDCFEDSKDIFRRKIVILIRLSLSLASIIAMAVVYPLQDLPLGHYIVLPMFLVLNFLICTLLLRKKSSRLSSIYISFVFFLVSTITFQLSLSMGKKLKEERGIFIGIEIGLLYSLAALSKMPQAHMFLGSLCFLGQILQGVYTETVGTPIVTFLMITMIMLLIFFSYYRVENLNFQTWRSLQRSHEALDRFRRLIDVLPLHLTLIDPESWSKDKFFYENKEVERQRLIMPTEQGGSLRNFLNKFILEKTGDSPRQCLDESYTLESLVETYVDNIKLGRKEKFETFLASFVKEEKKEFDEAHDVPKKEVIKFEVKIGCINWGESETIILVLNDISQTEKIRELRIINENKDQLLATVSHELRTPLNGIIATIDIIDDELGSQFDELKRFIEIARNSSKTLLFMINDILDISQIQKGHLRISIEPSPLNETIRKVLPLIQVLTREKGLIFQYTNTCADDVKVLVDPNRLQQILLNLLSNANKFTEKGFVRLSVGKKAARRASANEAPELEISESCLFSPEASLSELGEADSNQKVYISVEDTGKGIQPEHMNHLFELFGRFEHNNNATGVGLGLAISQRLAQRMGSKGIKVKSVLGKGSVFWFSLKTSRTDSTSEQGLAEDKSSVLKADLEAWDFRRLIEREHKDPPSKKRESQKARFLVVDDDQINQSVLQQYLKPFQNVISFDAAYNGAEAVSLVERNCEKNVFYSLILMDCDMPIMNGFQASELILKKVHQKKIPPLKIIAVTANVLFEDKEKCFQAGMSDVWSKPLSKREFQNKIINYLQE